MLNNSMAQRQNFLAQLSQQSNSRSPPQAHFNNQDNDKEYTYVNMQSRQSQQLAQGIISQQQIKNHFASHMLHNMPPQKAIHTAIQSN